ncbi:LIPOPROTEIN [Mycoplasmopsis pulmonis]|uniref:LIPOPROTEIN n=1 Tax=Mycoplasmopsis pulmonis (strain UAB CTIP) TaxID=272635 RepID=Q98R15_MYCPU|nr:aromatic motif membrane protein [Mycoplasmopsis pulmonis]MDZ7293161.1 hypothetical protein [Mycoplasmopsis pulmonis]CAC13368.1 LIPOPROTEIN [Mycoplasmopsis pulmonis]VEU67958.1 Uncharacterised protein [Mycoplasmopsis pulmonis]
MKKSLKLISSFLPLLTVFSVISCDKTQDNKEKNHLQIDHQKDEQISSQKSFSNQKHIQNLVNDFIDNSSEKNNYVLTQKNLPKTLLKQLQFSLVYFNNIWSSKDQNDIGHSQARKRSHEFILEALSSNWYWSLQNIDKFQYAFNPYGQRLKGYRQEKKDFEDHIKTFGFLSRQAKSNKIKNIYKINMEKLNEDVFQNKQIYYLEYENNLFLKIYKLQNKDKTIILIWPDLYWIKNTNNVEFYLQKFEQEIIKQRKMSIQNEIEPDEDENPIYKKYNDSHLYEKLFQGQYYDWIRNAIKSLNEMESENQIYRYTLRGIDEI